MKDKPIRRACSHQRFRNDVRNHQMTIVRDDGLHRHLTFKQPGTFNRHFHITTWPGYLCISGDMDCYVFSRLPDMFDFHRLPAGRDPDFEYWAEKVQAQEKHSDIYSYSEGHFEEAIRYWFRCQNFSSFRHARGVWEDLQECLLGHDFVNAQDAMTHACNWSRRIDGTTYRMEEFWEHRIEEVGFGFVWACYAIAWAVRQYDRAKAGNAQADHDKRVLRGAA